MTFDDRITIATPEGVDLELTLAGLGTRFIATLLDVLIQFGAILALSFAVGFSSIAGGGGGGVLLALYYVGIFLILFAYDVVLETWNHGRTIGKLAAGLRVVRADGRPVNFVTSAVRNIVRIADFLPAFYGVGIVTVVVTRRSQRLGDLAAGTIVVRTAKQPAAAPAGWADPWRVPAPAHPDWDVSAVTGDEVVAVRRFLERRWSLAPDARARLGYELAARLAPKVPGADPRSVPEAFLERLVAVKATRG